MNLHDLPNQFPAGERYLIGVSGGRDSVALLKLLLDAGYRNLVVCHLNHELRGEESAAHAEFVAGLAKKHGLEFCLESEDVAAKAAEAQLSIETAAREARIEFFGRCAARFKTSTVFLAHHADDQVETVLMRLFRGSGMQGLTGMRRVQELGELTLIRPLLEHRREEIPLPAEFCEDTSNQSDQFLRNRIRHSVIPAIEAATGRSLVPPLSRALEILGADNEWLDEQAAKSLKTCSDEEGRLAIPDLLLLPVSLQRRVLHLWLSAQEIADVGFAEVEAARSIIDPNADTAKINLPGGRHVRRRAKVLFVE